MVKVLEPQEARREIDNMVTLRTPSAPATSKQLWLLHILTKTDTRNLNITMAEASERIAELKHNDNHKGTRPMVNPHTSAIAQDKQKLAQARYDRDNPKPEREVAQGANPTGETDIDKVKAHFMANAYQIGRDFAKNDNARIDFYDFDCKECLFGKTGICEPKWSQAGFTTCQQIVEDVSFKCDNFESVKYSISDYCHRPKGKQCHRKQIENKCLECAYRKTAFRDGYNHTAWGTYIPTIEERIKHHSFWITQFADNKEALEQVNNIIALINKVSNQEAINRD